MFGYILAFLTGGLVATIIICCVVVAKDDREIEEHEID